MPECYHFSCDADATRLHITAIGRKERSTPCCDDHEPMAKTKTFVPIGTDRELTEQTTLDC